LGDGENEQVGVKVGAQAQSNPFGVHDRDGPARAHQIEPAVALSKLAPVLVFILLN
jgi:hypothetical protein